MNIVKFSKLMLPVIIIIGFLASFMFQSRFISMIIFCVFCMDVVFIMKYGGGFVKDKKKKDE